MSDGADSLSAEDANAATLFGGTENDTFNFTGDVKDSSIVGGFGADSLVVTDFVQWFHCLRWITLRWWKRTWMVLITSVLEDSFFFCCLRQLWC